MHGGQTPGDRCIYWLFRNPCFVLITTSTVSAATKRGSGVTKSTSRDRLAASLFFQSQLSRFVHQVCRLGRVSLRGTARTSRRHRRALTRSSSVALAAIDGATCPAVVRRLRLHRPVASPSRRTQGRKEMLLYVTRLINSFRREEDGQDLLEYALLVALIAIVAVTAVTAAGAERPDDLRKHREPPAVVRHRGIDRARALCEGPPTTAGPHNHRVHFRRTHDFAAPADHAVKMVRTCWSTGFLASLIAIALMFVDQVDGNQHHRLVLGRHCCRRLLLTSPS